MLIGFIEGAMRVINGLNYTQDLATRLERNADHGGCQQTGLGVDSALVKRVGAHIVDNQGGLIPCDPARDPFFQPDGYVFHSHHSPTTGFQD